MPPEEQYSQNFCDDFLEKAQRHESIDKRNRIVNGLLAPDTLLIVRAVEKYIKTAKLNGDLEYDLRTNDPIVKEIAEDAGKKIDERYNLIMYWVGHQAGKIHRILHLEIPIEFKESETNINKYKIEAIQWYAEGFYTGYYSGDEGVAIFNPPDGMWDYDDP